MYTIIEKKFIRFEGDKSVYRVHIDCDTINDIPSTELDDIIIAPCSTVYVINERKFLKLNHEGEWK